MTPLRNIVASLKTNPLTVQILALLITVVGPFASNMYLPSLPLLGQHLAASDEMMELTITAFLLGLCISQPIYGLLSDAFGRRKLLFAGLSIALVGSIGCALASTGFELIVARFILGCGIGAGAAITRSMLRDTYSGLQLTKAVSQNGIVFSIAPIVAPLTGGYVNEWFGWEANFIFVALLVCATWIVVWVLLIETNRYTELTAIYPKNVIKNYFSVLSNRTFIINALFAALASAGITAYVTISPFLFQEVFGLSPVEYGWITGIVVSGLVLGRFFNTILLSFFSLQRLLFFGIGLITLSGLMLFVLGFFHELKVPFIVIAVIIYMTATGFIMPNAYAKCLEPFAKNAGVAGALYGSVMLLLAFCVSVLVAMIPSNNPLLLGFIYICLALSIACVSYFELPIDSSDWIEHSEVQQ